MGALNSVLKKPPEALLLIEPVDEELEDEELEDEELEPPGLLGFEFGGLPEPPPLPQALSKMQRTQRAKIGRADCKSIEFSLLTVVINSE